MGSLQELDDHWCPVLQPGDKSYIFNVPVLFKNDERAWDFVWSANLTRKPFLDLSRTFGELDWKFMVAPKPSYFVPWNWPFWSHRLLHPSLFSFALQVTQGRRLGSLVFLRCLNDVETLGIALRWEGLITWWTQVVEALQPWIQKTMVKCSLKIGSPDTILRQILVDWAPFMSIFMSQCHLHNIYIYIYYISINIYPNLSWSFNQPSGWSCYLRWEPDFGSVTLRCGMANDRCTAASKANRSDVANPWIFPK